MSSSYDGKYNAKIKMRKNLEIVLNAKQKLHKSYGMYSLRLFHRGSLNITSSL